MLELVTAGNRRVHFALKGAEKTVCGKDVVAVEKDQSTIVPAPNDYNDGLQDLRHAVGCARCFGHTDLEDRKIVEETNLQNYKNRVANGTIVMRQGAAK